MDFPGQFELIKDKQIQEINTHAFLLKHEKTGAEVLYLKNDDQNKMFGIAFKTPVSDSTGVDHILEHCVLMGSEKYPLKQPLWEIQKTSLNTFLNAMTYQDKTFYPVASQNNKDFRNLMDVYLDAVFHPLLLKNTFKKEGWRFDYDAEKEKLRYTGIVFNEMKGGMSEENNAIYVALNKALYPDTIYHHSHGGDAEQIPNLTHEKLVEFHRKFYHPSNSRTVLYGNLNPQETLEHLNKYFSGFDFKKIDSQIKFQKSFTSPKYVKTKYGVGKGSSEDGMFVKTWGFLDDIGDEEALGLLIIQYLLCYSEASPIKKTILDKNLGKSPILFGWICPVQQTNFTFGVKGVQLGDFQRVNRELTDMLERLSKNINPDSVAGALNRVEFWLREGSTSQKGLMYSDIALNEWLYGRDPIKALEFETEMVSIRSRVEKGEKFFENLVKKYFLDNPHRADIEMHPDPELEPQKDFEEEKRLEKILAGFTGEDLKKLQKEVEEFNTWQELPDSENDMKTLPHLSLKDIDKDGLRIDSREIVVSQHTVQVNKLETNGIVYLDVAFDMLAIDEYLIPYVGLYIDAFRRLGTSERNHEELNLELERLTGGFGVETYTRRHFTQDKTIARVVFRIRCTEANFSKSASLLSEILTKTDFRDRKRLKKMVLESKKYFDESIVEDGNHWALSRAASYTSYEAKLMDDISGFGAYFSLLDLEKDIDARVQELSEKLEKLNSQIVNSFNLFINLSLEKDSKFLPVALEGVETILGDLPKFEVKEHKHKFVPKTLSEAFIASTNINHVVAVYPVPKLKMSGELLAVSNILSLDYLLEEIRTKGGAYGFGCAINQRAKRTEFSSFRDPNLDRSLGIYFKTAEFLRNHNFTKSEIEDRVIGTFAPVDSNLSTQEAHDIAGSWYLSGYTFDLRQKHRVELLGFAKTYKKSLNAFADLLEESKPVIVVVGGQSIKNAKTKFDSIHEL